MTVRINPDILRRVRAREEKTFADRIPKSAEMRKRAITHMPLGVPMAWMSGLYRFPPIYVTHGEGPRFFDIDGNGYLDFNVCDLSMTMGFGCKPIVEAVAKAVKEGAHFLLPTVAAVEVAEELSRRVGLPHWQFTLSATGANGEVLRVARQMTGRRKIAIFQGHYHGHLDQTLATADDSGKSEPELLGLLPEAADDTVILPFNDLARVEECLAGGDVALLLTEPAMTNCTLVEPQPGFLKGLRGITRRTGTLLCYDEAHTFQFAFGGLVRHWNLDPDFVVLGKGLGTGVSFALYGMSEQVAAFFSRHADVDIGPKGIATGGTTYASNIAVAAAHAALQQVLTPQAYEHLAELGAYMASGLDRVFEELALPWKAQHLGPRTGYCLFPNLPRNGEEAYLSIDTEFIDTRRVYMANRGIWDSVASAGPQVSFAHQRSDIDLYLQAAKAFLAEVTAG